MTEKILVIHQGALGDLVLSFPALISLKDEKKAFVCLLCKDELGKLAHKLGVVDAYFSLESAKLATLFSKEMTPFVKTFTGAYTTLVLLSFSESMERHVRRNFSGKVFRISPRPPADDETHVADSLVGEFQDKGLIRNQRVGSWREELAVGQGRHQPETGLCLIHPGAGSSRKLLPIEFFVQLAARLEVMNLGKVSFVIGPAELEMTSIIRARGFQLYDDCDLWQLIPLLTETTLFIGHDSGVTHLASFMNTPTIAIFGPSSPKRWAPLGRAVKVLRGEIDCEPCFEIENANCDNPRCLHGVTIDMVLGAIKALNTI
ncbi:MAG: glycosyltransferase family 9 protein [Deltaproteobacteria bacterium]|nr:glycosyltransferase family 9 protein [Deltaproteobacteria bacterium]